MRKRLMFLLVATLAAIPSLVSHAQAPAGVPALPVHAADGLALSPILATLAYGAIGLILYVLGYILFDKLLKLDLRKELVVDQNDALGMMMAGVFIGLAIIIAAAIK